jgi:RNA polymerase primary sigma factor
MTLSVKNNRRGGKVPAVSIHDMPDPGLMSRSDEGEPSAQPAGGDWVARNRLVQANLGLVFTVARQFRCPGLEFDDLISEGNIGLIRAAERFDPTFGKRFSTYAVYWIKASIRSAMMNTASTIRVPAHTFRLLGKWRQAENRFRQQWNRGPRFDEVAEILGLSETQKSLVAQGQLAGQVNLESSSGTEPGNLLSETATDGRTALGDLLEAEEERALVSRRMGRLDERERAILAMRYGLEGELLTLREVGRRLGMSHEGVRTIELRALRKLSSDEYNHVVDFPYASWWSKQRHRRLDRGDSRGQSSVA